MRRDSKQNETEMDSSLVGYGIIIFVLIFGFLIWIMFDNLFVFFGLLLIFLAFIFLAVQLSEDKLTKYSFASLGLGFMFPALYLSNAETFYTKIIFIIFISFAITFFVIGLLYSVKIKKKEQDINNDFVEIQDDFKRKRVTLVDVIFKIIEVSGLLLSIYELIEKLS